MYTTRSQKQNEFTFDNNVKIFKEIPSNKSETLLNFFWGNHSTKIFEQKKPFFPVLVHKIQKVKETPYKYFLSFSF